MGGTDFIENPGPYLHRSSKKAPYLGVLSTPPGFKVPASGAPVPPLPAEERPMSREAAVQAYAARLDALNALGLSGPGADPPEMESPPEEVPKDLERVETVVPPLMDVQEEQVLVEAVTGADTSGNIAFLPSRTGPFQTISTPLYPKDKQPLDEERQVRTPRWRGG
jgi:hypothetical protein